MGTVRFLFSLVSVQREILTRFGGNLRLPNFDSIWWNFPLILRGDHRKTSHSFWEEALLGRITRSPVRPWPFCDQSFRQRPYCVEYTRSHPNSEVKLRKARSVLGWGTAWEALRVLLAFIFVRRSEGHHFSFKWWPSEHRKNQVKTDVYGHLHWSVAKIYLFKTFLAHVETIKMMYRGTQMSLFSPGFF